MSSLLSRLALLVVVPMVLLAGPTASVAEDPAPGDRAPDFELPGSDGKTYTLSQFAGKQGVVLAWFPKAFTPG